VKDFCPGGCEQSVTVGKPEFQPFLWQFSGDSIACFSTIPENRNKQTNNNNNKTKTKRNKQKNQIQPYSLNCKVRTHTYSAALRYRCVAGKQQRGVLRMVLKDAQM